MDRIRHFICVIIIIMAIAGSALAEDIIIVNKNNPINDISSVQLKKIYNGKIKFWDNGTRIIPLDLIDENPSASKFASVILGVDLETKRRFWMQKLYAGAGTPPQQEKNSSKVISIVASEPGAIGYVKRENLTSAVKHVTVDGKQDY